MHAFRAPVAGTSKVLSVYPPATFPVAFTDLVLTVRLSEPPLEPASAATGFALGGTPPDAAAGQEGGLVWNLAWHVSTLRGLPADLPFSVEMVGASGRRYDPQVLVYKRVQSSELWRGPPMSQGFMPPSAQGGSPMLAMNSGGESHVVPEDVPLAVLPGATVSTHHSHPPVAVILGGSGESSNWLGWLMMLVVAGGFVAFYFKDTPEVLTMLRWMRKAGETGGKFGAELKNVVGWKERPATSPQHQRYTNTYGSL